MTLRTKEGYLESLKEQKPIIYMYGKKIENRVEHPLIKPQLDVFGLTYEFPHRPEYRELTTAISHISGKRINRFTHIHQSREDLLNKIRMTRMYCRYCVCIQRCMAVDALNALTIICHEIDEKHGTDYYKRLLKYIRFFQEEDVAATCAMTDVKGDRSLRPADQPDPDMYLRVVKETDEGITVRGAKCHTTAAIASNELIVMPTRAMRDKDKDYAVAFAIPVDAEGIKFICRSTALARKRILDFPFRSKWAVTETVTIFDDVFVPWDRVFMCGEWEYAGLAAELFAIYHRHSYCGCKPAVTDMLVGTAALLAEYNGVENASHIRSKLTDMACTAEQMWACGVAASCLGEPRGPGTYVPNITLVNIGKYIAGTHIYDEIYRVHDIGGGLIITCPSDEDYFNPETKSYLEKYLKGKGDIPTEHRIRAFKLAEDLTAYGFAGWLMVASCHGGGSPEAQKITIYRSYDFERRKKIAKCLAGICDLSEFPEFEL